nr:patatin-like phospholipase family protein [Archangium gephyra]
MATEPKPKRASRRKKTPGNGSAAHGNGGAEAAPAAGSGKYRIISLDGGGIRTLLSLGIIKRIEQERPGFLAETHLLAGTSAGALSALIIAAARDPLQGLEQARNVWFSPGLFDIPVSNQLGALVGQKALTPNEPMARALTNVLGDKTLGDLRRHVIIPAFQLDDRNPDEDLRGWRPRVFHNLPGDTFVNMGEFLVDLALRSSAMPVISPLYQGYADGGLFANNPTLAAVAQALYAKVTTREELLVLSLGTGDSVDYLEGYNEDWGWRKWIMDARQPMAFINASIEANVEAIEFQTQMLLPKGSTRRVDPLVPFNLGSSVEQQVATMDRVVKRFDLSKTLAWVDESGWMPSRRPRRAGAAVSEASAPR